MFRRSRALLLLTVLLWQSLVMLTPTTFAKWANEWEHLIVHGQGESHHHHADHAWHLDEEDGPIQHVHVDFGVTTADVLVSSSMALMDVRSIAPALARDAEWASPTLEGPLRPPRQGS